MFSERKQSTLLIFNAMYLIVTNSSKINDTNFMNPSRRDLQEETNVGIFHSFQWRQY